MDNVVMGMLQNFDNPNENEDSRQAISLAYSLTARAKL